MCVLVFALVVIIASTHSSKPRSVNVALETILEFDNKDDLDFIDTMQGFLDKLKLTITRNKANDLRTGNREMNTQDIVMVTNANGNFKFTDFITNTIKVLKSYTDDDLKMFFRTLDGEIKTWGEENQFFELSNKVGFRRLVSDTLKEMKESEASGIRKILNAVSRKLNGNTKHSFITDLLNSLYRLESQKRFNDFLNNLKLYQMRNRRNILDLGRIIRSGIKTIIIDPISRLSPETIDNIKGLYQQYWVKKTISKPVLKFSEKKVSDEIGYTKELIIKVPFRDEILDDFNKMTKKNDVLDYIEDHNSVIERHLTTRTFATPRRTKPKKIRHKTTPTLDRYHWTTRTTKRSTLRHDTHKLNRKKKTKKHRKHSIKYNTELSDENNRFELEEVQKPLLIEIESSDESKNEDMFRYTTTKRTAKSRYRKPKTTRRPYSLRTTRKSRKAFKTTAISQEGLSIEHFGSLYNLNVQRKSNVNDSFTQSQANTTRDTKETTMPTGADNSVELKRSDDLDRENEIYINEKESSEAFNTTKRDNIEDKPIQVTNKVIIDIAIETEKPELVPRTSNVILIEPKRKTMVNGEIKAEGTATVKINPSETKESDGTGEESGESTVPYGDLVANDTSSTTDSIKHVKLLAEESKDITPFFLRSEDVSSTNVSTTKIPAFTTTTPSITRTKADSTPTNTRTNTHTNTGESTDAIAGKDGLENELENIMDKYNTSTAKSTLPAELNEFLKINLGDNGKMNRRMRDQMRADIEKLLAPTTTTTAAPLAFTDPFKDLDDELDLM